MKQRILFRTGFLLVLFIGLSFLFFGSGQSGSCSIASAQDNPCLSQDATISAMQLELLGAQATASAAQLENLNLQSTITVLEASGGVVAAIPSTSATCDPYPISETFDDNARGISTISQEYGRATVTDGQVQMRFSGDKGGQMLFVQVPGVCMEANFYVELDVAALEFEYSIRHGEIGVAIGNIEGLDYHTFAISGPELIIRHIVNQEAQETLVESEYTDFISIREPLAKLGLESRNGIITLYVNGTDYEAIPVALNGNSFALYTISRQSGWTGAFVAFDNLIVRTAR